MKAKKPIDIPFARAWLPIMHNRNLTPLEKLVLVEVCRFWPSAYIGSNATIAANTGISIRHIQRILKKLSTGPAKLAAQGHARRRAYIGRGYHHFQLKGKPYTVRMIVPQCLPGKAQPPPASARHEALFGELTPAEVFSSQG